jgi:hypothetical protein
MKSEDRRECWMYKYFQGRHRCLCVSIIPIFVRTNYERLQHTSFRTQTGYSWNVETDSPEYHTRVLTVNKLISKERFISSFSTLWIFIVIASVVIIVVIIRFIIIAAFPQTPHNWISSWFCVRHCLDIPPISGRTEHYISTYGESQECRQLQDRGYSCRNI